MAGADAVERKMDALHSQEKSNNILYWYKTVS